MFSPSEFLNAVLRRSENSSRSASPEELLKENQSVLQAPTNGDRAQQEDGSSRTQRPSSVLPTPARTSSNDVTASCGQSALSEIASNHTGRKESDVSEKPVENEESDKNATCSLQPEVENDENETLWHDKVPDAITEEMVVTDNEIRSTRHDEMVALENYLLSVTHAESTRETTNVAEEDSTGSKTPSDQVCGKSRDGLKVVPASVIGHWMLEFHQISIELLVLISWCGI